MGPGPGARRRARGLRDVGTEDARQGGPGRPPRGDLVRRYVHIGTGNYNPSTARLYTDLGLFTCREDLAEDVADLFNHLTGFARAPSYRKALVAPDHIRDGVIAEIDRVVAAHTPESPSRVVMKLNSLIDGPVIRAIYGASQAGVQVDLILRGIAGLRPGVPGVSENVRVISIVGRFLEHARILAFTAAGRPPTGSAPPT